MKWKTQDKSSGWQRWFAWHPVRLNYLTDAQGEQTYKPHGGNLYVWFEVVERKAYETWGGGGYDYRNAA